jgi:hypothetical protein
MTVLVGFATGSSFSLGDWYTAFSPVKAIRWLGVGVGAAAAGLRHDDWAG